MPRHEQTITAAGPLAGFARELREFRRRAGSPTYRHMGAAVRYSHSVLCRAASGRTLPSWEATRAYLRACGADAAQLAEWRERHRDTKAALRTVAEPASGDDGDPALRLLRQVSLLVRSRNPGPDSVGSPQDFARAMRHLRLAADLSLRELSRRAAEEGGPVSVGALADLCEPGRRTWPDDDTVAAFLSAIGVAGEQAAAWLDRLAALRAEPVEEPREGGWCERATAVLDDAERVVRVLWERPLSRADLAGTEAVAAVAGLAILADDPGAGPDGDVFDRLYHHLSEALTATVAVSASVGERLAAAHRQGREAQTAAVLLEDARGVVDRHAAVEGRAEARARLHRIDRFFTGMS
ncbi:helix-turn-helix domain-containing protein [Phytomonospora endophytica]|uniref:HTH cro/C1-type domain-containing protein n=1 Tax=Phytomonospora endophytica TaxID=714109 RepID=A0A841FTP9_9ACTN|nr:helix-turn-helix transcriptional regulator [Phytomonospora endophytica]MBB6038163.1 hypothetical protein [Phytomonospora endophytica]GIG67374.1 hypothetical protein Pen01_36690 [Phytomonospora endophytica]